MKSYANVNQVDHSGLKGSIREIITGKLLEPILPPRVRMGKCAIIKRIHIPIAFLFGIFSILFIWFGEADNVSVLIKEDGVVENLSAIFYMAGFIVCLISIFKVERKLLPIIWAVLCFVFLGEETSWFQRIFHYSVPEVEKINVQNEFNFHNLIIFHGGHLTSPSIGLSDFIKAQNLFRFGFFSYFLATPLMMYIPIFKRLMSKVGYNKPDTGFTLVLLFVFALSFILALFSPANVKSALAETREMLYAFFIMLYVINYVWSNKTIRLTSDVGNCSKR